MRPPAAPRYGTLLAPPGVIAPALRMRFGRPARTRQEGPSPLRRSEGTTSGPTHAGVTVPAEVSRMQVRTQLAVVAVIAAGWAAGNFTVVRPVLADSQIERQRFATLESASARNPDDVD